MARSRLISLMVVIFSTLVTLVVGLCIVYIGSRMTGGLEGYDRFLSTSTPAFLVWRVLLYAATVAAWLGHFRKRVVGFLMEDNDGGHDGLRRLRRLEYMAVGFVVLIELYNLNTAWGQA